MNRKKRPASRKKRIFSPKKRKAAHLHPDRAPLDVQIMSLLAGQSEAMSLPEIMKNLGSRRKDRARISRTLELLTRKRKLRKKARQYLLSGEVEHLRGRLGQTAAGFGFVTTENQSAEEKDVFISSGNMGNASHGDTVIIALLGTSRGRREGRVVRVVARATTRLCGIFRRNGQRGYVTPDNDKLPYTVQIHKGQTGSAENDMAVVVEITDFGSERVGPTGKIVEILGDPHSVAVQIRMAIMEFRLRDRFSEKILVEAEALEPITTCEKGRQDLRHLCHVTIDGADARDFDDAICVEKTDKGYTLYVSIADVSSYVKPDSAIDKEAFARGTSVYLPDRVIPMLPEQLANNLCSLVPDEDRAAFTAILTFDKKGGRTGSRYSKSLIQSKKRCTYDLAHRLMYLKEPELRTELGEIAPMLDSAAELAELLREKRVKRGSLGFNIPEPVIQVNGEDIAGVSLSERNQAHMLVEECMLAANEAVAETMAGAGRDVLYRIHEDPDPARLEGFMDVCRSLGFTLPQKDVSPAWFAEVLASTKETPLEYVVNNLLLRTMQQARYFPENKGHFGLAAEYYLHFTSPIRRYPDLIAHRALQGLLLQDKHAPLVPGMSSDLFAAAVQLSQCERTAIDAERSVHARLAVLFLKDRIGEKFSAVISGVTGFGLFVELKEYYISGAIPVKTMTDDYYLHDGKRHLLLGERTNTIFRLGDEVEVQLVHADLYSKRITFALAALKSKAG